MDSLDVYMQAARERPYNNRPAKDWAEAAAHGVLANLMDRSGIKHALRPVEGDEETTEEIVLELAEIIRRSVPTSDNP